MLYDICMNYTVNISLPKPLADQAKAKVKQGHYASLSEVIRTALRNFLTSDVPVYKISTKAERKALKALKDHKEGKTRQIKSLDDLDDL